MRWATERGLPVHRIPGAGRGSVYALTEERDAWLGSTAAVEADAAIEGAITAGEAAKASAAVRSRGWSKIAVAALLVVTSRTTPSRALARG